MADEAAVYTLQGIVEMLGISRDVVMGFVKAGFVVPRRGLRNSHRFDFQDVVLLRTAQSLRAADIPARRIHRALKLLRAQLPPTAPLTGLRITAIGDDVAVRDGDQDVALESGQFLLDFDVTSGPGAVLSFPDHRSVTRDAVDADAWLDRGAALLDAGDVAAALALYDAALALLPEQADLHFNRAIVLEDLDRPDDALAAYARCLQLAPAFADAHWNAGRLQERRGAKQQALQHFSAFKRLQR